MRGTENFARLHIDTVPHRAENGSVTSHDLSATEAAASVPILESSDSQAFEGTESKEHKEPGTSSRRFWQRPFSFFGKSRSQEHLRKELEPPPGEAYRMVPAAELLNRLDISNPEAGYLDDEALTALEVRLRRLGLDIAISITGPLRLRMSDLLPVVDIDSPQASRYSPVTVCLYLIAWMLQGGNASPQDLVHVDRWIDDYAHGEPWSETAKGTFRWLMSRKLILTYKRKQRTGRIKRFVNVRSRLVSLLLALVSDPEGASPKRMERLRTIYGLLELDPATIHSDLHRLSTIGSFQAPRAERVDAKEWAPDSGRLKEMAQSTARAQSILADIFSETAVAEPELIPEAEATRGARESQGRECPASPGAEGNQSVSGEEASPALQMLRALAEREVWTRQEAEVLASDHHTTLGAMLEGLNDLAWEVAGENVVDDEGDTLYVAADVAEICLAHLT